MAHHQTQAKVMVTLRSGECLEISDDLISQAFRELGEDLANLKTTARTLAGLVRASHPVIEYVAEGGAKYRPDSAPTERAASCLEASREILRQLDGGRKRDG